MKLKLYQIDAFTSEVFKGNPAAVCPLDEWLDDSLMQSIATENNLSDEKELIFVEQNVNYQVNQAMDRYKERIKKKRLVVVGSVLDVANYYDKGHNQLFIININGETDPKKMKKMQLLRTFRPELLGNVGRPGK